MEKVQRGMMAWSQAGHDRGKLYVIVGMNREYVWLCDGSIRPLENPKKKKMEACTGDEMGSEGAERPRMESDQK